MTRSHLRLSVHPALALGLLLAGLLLLGPAASAQPEEGSTAGTRWTLDLEHGPLKIVAIDMPDGRRVTHHYQVLKVTNDTGLARPWWPMVKLHTDTDRSYVAGGHRQALEAIRREERNESLEPIEGTAGKIAAGATLETVAIFGPLDPLYDQVRIHVYGLADPIAIYKVEVYDEGEVIQDIAYAGRNRAVMEAVAEAAAGGEAAEPEVVYREVAERRVYEMVYERQGDEFRPDEDQITDEAEGWTIVGDPKTLRTIEVS